MSNSTTSQASIPSKAAPPAMEDNEVVSIEEPISTEPAPKKQRTAYVMTEKRKEAFAKCQQARLKNIQARKEQAATKA